ncbi:MAG: hypothetical protein LBV67_05830, partial [Streptococcaceae bacterium]|nr:hypothetical protein [Streptococcaceae bacterium]
MKVQKKKEGILGLAWKIDAQNITDEWVKEAFKKKQIYWSNADKTMLRTGVLWMISIGRSGDYLILEEDRGNYYMLPEDSFYKKFKLIEQ